MCGFIIDIASLHAAPCFSATNKQHPYMYIYHCSVQHPYITLFCYIFCWLYEAPASPCKKEHKNVYNGDHLCVITQLHALSISCVFSHEFVYNII